jgi:hypothetical protein
MNNRWLVYVYPQGYDTPYRAGWFDTQEEAEKQLELLASLSSEDFITGNSTEASQNTFFLDIKECIHQGGDGKP